VNIEEKFEKYLDAHTVNARNKFHLHASVVNLLYASRSAYFATANVFNSLSCRFRVLINEKSHFKIELKRNLYTYYFFLVIIFCNFLRDGKIVVGDTRTLTVCFLLTHEVANIRIT
jgi:hypothetical protein